MLEDLTFAEILNLLFELCPAADGGLYRNQDLVDAIGVSRSAVSNWRKQIRSNVSLDNAVAIADFFGVPLDVFQCQTRAEVIRVIAQAHESQVAVETDALVNRIIEKVLARWSGSERRLILTVIEGVVDHTANLTELPPQPDDNPI